MKHLRQALVENVARAAFVARCLHGGQFWCILLATKGRSMADGKYRVMYFIRQTVYTRDTTPECHYHRAWAASIPLIHMAWDTLEDAVAYAKKQNFAYGFLIMQDQHEIVRYPKHPTHSIGHSA